jgi:uncharacterized integral membrane protein
MLFLVLVVLAVAGFAVQNWPEITRSTNLTFGVLQTQAPLGLILLTLVGVLLIAYLASTASLRTQSLMESRRHARDLHAQRELAEKAEASRFTELRAALDTHLRESRQRDSAANTELERAMAQHQRELRNQLEQMYHLLTSRLGELERRLEPRAQQRVERVETVQPTRMDEPPLHTSGRERVEPQPR